MHDDLTSAPLADDGDAWLDAQLTGLRAYTPRARFEDQVLWQVDGWVDARLGALRSFAPSGALEERVMARVGFPAAAPALAATPSIPAPVRLPARRRFALAASVAAMMGASAWWSVAHQALLTTFSTWVTTDALATASAYAQASVAQIGSLPLMETLRQSVGTPLRLAAAGTGIALLYSTSFVALRRLMALPDTGVQHAAR
jgi:hypothetical protein